MFDKPKLAAESSSISEFLWPIGRRGINARPEINIETDNAGSSRFKRFI
jgi:hypothetical protein